MKKTRPHRLSLSSNPRTAFLEGAFVGEPQVPTTFERSASAAEYPPAGAGFQRKPLVHQNKKGTPAGAFFYFGGPDRDRTGDLTDAKSHLNIFCMISNGL